MGVGLSANLLAARRPLFFLLGCLVHHCYDGACLILLSHVLSYLVDITGRPAFFSEGKWVSSGYGEGGLVKIQERGGSG